MTSHPLRCSSCGYELASDSATVRYGGACPQCLKAFALEGLLSASAPTPVPAGGEFGKFMLTDRLGKGGMGEVWKAFDKELNRWVALKFLRSESPEELARFQREARTAAALSHPGIAAIYEVGETEGRQYIAMQYVEGRTLATFPRQDRKLLARLIRDVALALDHAHRQGVIHRDLKPENLIVEKGGDDVRIMILDFGLARRIEGGESLSRSGTVVGTVAYMSPEQARGDKLDERADVYSLGATLYEVLTGKPLFEGANIYEIMQKVEDAEPANPRRLNPHIPSDLETITLKCLEKDRERRYGTAKDLADDLQRFLDGDAVMARRQSTIYRLRMKLAKKKVLLFTGVVGLSASIYLAIQWFRESAVREQKERQVQETQFLARQKEQSLKQLNSLWTKLILAKQDLYRAQADPGRVRAPIEEVAREITKFVQQNPSLPQAFYIAAKARLILGDLKGAQEALRRATMLDRDFYPANALLARVLLVGYSNEPYLRGNETVDERLQRLAPLLAEAQRYLSLGWSRGGEPVSIERWGIIKTRDDEVSDVLAQALVMHYVEKDEAKAKQFLERANAASPCEEYCYQLGLLLKNPAHQIEWQTRALALMPHFYAAYFERANASEASIGSSRSGSSDDVRVRWDFTAEQQRNHAQAVADLDRALSIHPGSVEALLRRAHIRDDFRGKIEDYTRALELGVSPRSRESQILSHRAYERSHIEDFAGAVADYSAAIEKVGDEPEEIPYLKFRRARSRIEVGDQDGALEDYTYVFEARSVILAKRFYLYDECFEALFERAKIRKMRGEKSAAIVDLTKGIEEWKALRVAAEARRVSPSDKDYLRQMVWRDVKIGKWYWELAVVRHELGDLNGARADLQEAIKQDSSNAGSRMWEWGRMREAAGDSAAAQDAFQKAAELNPKWVGSIYFAQAIRKLEAEGELSGQADLSRAVQLNPQAGYDLRWHWHCALNHVKSGRNEEARNAFKKAAESNPLDLDDMLYALRAMARAKIGDFSGSASDEASAIAKGARNAANAFFQHGRFLHDNDLFAEALVLLIKAADLPLGAQFTNYCRLYIWLAYARLGERSKADRQLQEYLKAGDPNNSSGWYRKIVDFLLGNLSEEELLREALVPTAMKEEQKGRECEAYFYAGSKRFLEGDLDKSRSYLEKCVATNLTDFMEYQSAQTVLKRWQTRK